MRQAYDYWQDQPGNYGAKRLNVGPTRILRERESVPPPLNVHTKRRKTSARRDEMRISIDVKTKNIGFD